MKQDAQNDSGVKRPRVLPPPQEEAGAVVCDCPPPPAPVDLTPLELQLETVAELQAALLIEIQQLKQQERLLGDLQDECRNHREQFHEREVVGPVVQGLIALSDRCHGDIRRLRELECKRSKGTLGFSLAHYVELRETDLAEIDAILGALGVETFEHPSNQFDPGTQTCRQRVLSTTQPQGQIAARLRPGFRRRDRIVRRELVTVYVTAESA